MDPASSSLIPELFAANAAWMRRLARSLLVDEAQAEDALQDTWLELLRKPPRHSSSTKGWLRIVLKNFARKRHREDARRARREHAVARLETITLPSQEIVERVEVSQRLVSLVLELGEPYRSTILLRFFEDLRPADIARRQGIPVTTVSSRIRHALDVLKRRLERDRPGTWKAILVLIALQGAGTSVAAAASGASSAKLAGLVGGAGTASNLNLTGTGVMTGAILMSKKAVLVACLSSGLFLSGGLSFWCMSSSFRAGEDQAERNPEEAAKVKGLLSALQSTKRSLDEAERENASLSSAKRALEAELAGLRGAGAGKGAAQEGPAGAPESPSGLNWVELSGLISGNLDVLEKLARNEQLDPEEQSKFDLLSGELLKLSSRAKQISKDPLLEEPIFRDLVSTLFREPLSLSEKQVEALQGIMDGVFEDVPESLEGMSSLDRYRVREQMVSRLESGVEALLTEEQKESWEGVQSFARMAFTYGGKMTLGTESSATSFLTNWSPNALGRPLVEGALQNATPLAEAYLERAKALLDGYATSSDALKGLSREARAALDGEFINLQKAFYEELSPHLGEDLRAKLHDADPLIIRFEPGPGVWIHGRRRYF